MGACNFRWASMALTAQRWYRSLRLRKAIRSPVSVSELSRRTPFRQWFRKGPEVLE